ncbi:response regulator [bacterium]|nr:MAG: response regulator [bacterium]
MNGPGGVMKEPVLVVDDEKFFQELLIKILRQEGYDVTVAGSGQEALKAFHGGGYRVVVLDLVLPDIMGTDVLTRLKEMDQDVAVIMVTAYASLESAIDALKAGAYDYIRKPIVREDLLRSVERAFEKQHLTVENRMLVRQLQARLEEVKSLGREKEEVFRILDEGLVVLENNGKIVDLNPKAEQLLDWQDQPSSKGGFLPSSFPLPEGFLEAVADSARQPLRATVSFKNNRSENKTVELVGLSMDLGAEASRFLLGIRDITEIKDLERRREEFLAIVTHDLRTPLTSMKGFIELLMKEEHEADGTVKNYLRIIDSEADRMTALINDLLDLDKIDSDKLKLDLTSIVLSDMLTYGIKSMEGLGRQRDVILRLSIRGDKDSLIFTGDKRRFLQILMNLYSNAIRFSPKGGSVDTIAYLENGHVIVEILDEGPGVPSEERERIFEKYHQVGQPSPERAKGSGLGLAIVRKILELHGGSIRMENREDKQGSRFVVKLPASTKGVV